MDQLRNDRYQGATVVTQLTTVNGEVEQGVKDYVYLPKTPTRRGRAPCKASSSQWRSGIELKH